LIPIEWIREEGPELSPEEIIKGNKVLGPCLEWGGTCTDSGYGLISMGRTSGFIHRAVWENANGPIPEDMVIMHLCDNPSCYRLSHLKMGTRSENMQDMYNKGREGHCDQRGTKNPRAKLTEAQVVSIRADIRPPALVAAEYGVTPQLIRQITSRKIWRHIP
jgi:hypothetical protein